LAGFFTILHFGARVSGLIEGSKIMWFWVILFCVIIIAFAVMFIILFFTVNKISRVQDEIIKSGAFPAMTIIRAKQDALEILEDRVIGTDEKLEEINQALSNLAHDAEAQEILLRLKEKYKPESGQSSVIS
jgi:hypothetical protein